MCAERVLSSAVQSADGDFNCVQSHSGRLQWNPPMEPDVPVAMVGQDAEARLLAERQFEMEARVRAFN